MVRRSRVIVGAVAACVCAAFGCSSEFLTLEIDASLLAADEVLRITSLEVTIAHDLGSATRSWGIEAELEPADDHPVYREAERRLWESEEHRELWKRILELSGRLGSALDGEPKELWLEVEADLNHYSSLIAAEHYNLGVEAGLARRVVDDVLTDAGVDAKMMPAAAVRALVSALARISERLEPGT